MSFAAGDSSRALGANAVALGDHAVVNGDGSFLFADASASTDAISSTPNEFAVVATGGIALGTARDFSNVCRLAPGGGSWSCTSDRNAKRDFASVDTQAVLDRVLGLPITTWRFKTQPDSVRHMGPMAQDFRAAFGLGIDERTITQVDVNGVALASIQALHARLASQQELVVAQGRLIDALRAELEMLARRIGQMAP